MKIRDIMEKIDDAFYKIVPNWFYHFFHGIFNFKSHIQSIKFFFQRLYRGWDDSETWDIDYHFLIWLQPRLERFIELTNGYPHHYNSYDEWISELKKRNEQLKLVIEYYYNEYNFPDTSYSDKKDDDIIIIKIDSYYKLQTDFLKWLSENINHLWW